jgi:hypothetical protein
MNTHSENVVQEIDEALAQEHVSLEKQSEERLNVAVKEREKISQMGTVLRYIGVAVLMAATGAFMFQRWGDMTHMSRYFTFLAFTAGVCGAGLLCGLKIGENKGARTLLGAVVVLLPVHCAQIGAILFSRIGGGVHASDYPSYFFWSVPSLADAVIIAVVGAVALLPMAYMAYSVLARNYARHLMLLGCAVSSVLLVPTRDPLLVGLLMSVAGVVACLGEIKLSAVAELKTREAGVARCVPFLAMAMLVGRQGALYQSSSLFEGIVCTLMSTVLFEIVPRITTKRAIARFSERAALYTTGLSCYLIAEAVLSGFALHGTAVAPVAVGLPMTLVFAVMAERARETSKLFRTFSAVALFITGLVEIVGGVGLESSIIALVIGIFAVAYACVSEQKSLLFAGGALTVLSLGRVTLFAIGSLSFSPWIILGVIGIVTIVGASYLERNFTKLRDGVFSARKRVSVWR